VPGDVFEKGPLGGAFLDDAGDFWPEVTGIVCAAAFTSSAERLARISGQYCVEGTAEGPSVETAQIIPDWRGRKIPCALGGDEDSSGPVLPFDKGAGVITGLGEHEAQIKATAACTEG